MSVDPIVNWDTTIRRQLAPYVSMTTSRGCNGHMSPGKPPPLSLRVLNATGRPLVVSSMYSATGVGNLGPLRSLLSSSSSVYDFDSLLLRSDLPAFVYSTIVATLIDGRRRCLFFLAELWDALVGPYLEMARGGNGSGTADAERYRRQLATLESRVQTKRFRERLETTYRESIEQFSPGHHLGWAQAIKAQLKSRGALPSKVKDVIKALEYLAEVTLPNSTTSNDDRETNFCDYGERLQVRLMQPRDSEQAEGYARPSPSDKNPRLDRPLRIGSELVLIPNQIRIDCSNPSTIDILTSAQQKSLYFALDRRDGELSFHPDEGSARSKLLKVGAECPCPSNRLPHWRFKRVIVVERIQTPQFHLDGDTQDKSRNLTVSHFADSSESSDESEDEDIPDFVSKANFERKAANSSSLTERRELLERSRQAQRQRYEVSQRETQTVASDELNELVSLLRDLYGKVKSNLLANTLQGVIHRFLSKSQPEQIPSLGNAALELTVLCRFRLPEGLAVFAGRAIPGLILIENCDNHDIDRLLFVGASCNSHVLPVSLETEVAPGATSIQVSDETVSAVLACSLSLADSPKSNVTGGSGDMTLAIESDKLEETPPFTLVLVGGHSPETAQVNKLYFRNALEVLKRAGSKPADLRWVHRTSADGEENFVKEWRRRLLENSQDSKSGCDLFQIFALAQERYEVSLAKSHLQADYLEDSTVLLDSLLLAFRLVVQMIRIDGIMRSTAA